MIEAASVFTQNLDLDAPATLGQALTLMWQGMLGIFIVAIIIIGCASLFNAITKKKNKD